MSSMPENPYQATFATDAVGLAEEWERTTFIRRTYSHLAGAIALFALLEVLIFTAVPAATLEQALGWMLGGRWSWLIVIGLFVVVSMVARGWASSATSLPIQYAGLGLYVLAQAVIFVPLLYMAQRFEGVISAAVLMTTIMFVSLTLMVFVTKADFSWLGRWLYFATFGAMGLILLAILFNFSLGPIFAGAMVLVMCGFILNDTSNVLHHFRTDQYVAASLELFASVALLFWYVLQLLMMFSGRD